MGCLPRCCSTLGATEIDDAREPQQSFRRFAVPQLNKSRVVLKSGLQVHLHCVSLMDPYWTRGENGISRKYSIALASRTGIEPVSPP